jgi:hypothetical protein
MTGTAAPLPATSLIFGQEGNVVAAQGEGWSAPEPGYT